jgi:hypothetical protein
MTSQGFLIRAPIFQPSAGTASSSSLGASLDRDFTEDYPEIGGNSCWNPAIKGTTSAWWPQQERLPRTVPAGTPPLGDLKHLMLRHPATDWFGI